MRNRPFALGFLCHELEEVLKGAGLVVDFDQCEVPIRFRALHIIGSEAEL